MLMDMEMGIPYLPEDLPVEERQRVERENRRLFLLGGAMGGIGSYMTPVYPLLLDPLEDEEVDPNP